MTVVDSLSGTRADAIVQLRKAASAYVDIYGHPQGLYELGEDLCRIVAKDYDETAGWTHLIQHLMKISG